MINDDKNYKIFICRIQIKQCKQTVQHPRDKPLIGTKYIKHHNLKCSLKPIKVNRDLNAVVTLGVTVELGKAFHSGNNPSAKNFYVQMFYLQGTIKRHVLPRKCERLV